ncbi:MAG: peptide ABC transporter permease [Chloroflexi bacterium RBG_16_50_9]|nr:MAG: peptide ABC transporter permease [Chloroflexi bacterium RBG_16_50_9]
MTETALGHRRIDLTAVFRRARKFPVLPVILLMPFLVWGIFGPLLYPHDPTAMNLSMALRPPSWVAGGDPAFLLGTDSLGRDLLSRLIEGARASLLVSVFAVILSGFIGVTLGMTAGYVGKTTDNVIMRIVDAEMSIPGILLIMLLSAILERGLTTIIISISVVFWTGYARVIRGETLSITQRDFVALAKVTGCSTFRILINHILPNLVNTIMVLSTLQIGMAIMMEASITFLGLGIQPPDTAWGLMIAESRIYMSTAWWIPTFSGLCITITILGANLFGDWLRDTLDPRRRQV